MKPEAKHNFAKILKYVQRGGFEIVCAKMVMPTQVRLSKSLSGCCAACPAFALVPCVCVCVHARARALMRPLLFARSWEMVKGCGPGLGFRVYAAR